MWRVDLRGESREGSLTVPAVGLYHRTRLRLPDLRGLGVHVGTVRRGPRLILLAALLAPLPAIAGCDSSTKTVTVTSQATTSTHPRSTQAVANPCANYTLTAHTSCPFAQAVVKAYDVAPSTTVTAYSPVTGKPYTMQCAQAQGVGSCAGGIDSGVAFRGPPIPGAASSTPTATTTSSAVEGPGSSSYATDAQFCSTHQCIPNFPNGNGYIVQCVDGEWSHSGGLSGACSDHGGES